MCNIESGVKSKNSFNSENHKHVILENGTEVYEIEKHIYTNIKLWKTANGLFAISLRSSVFLFSRLSIPSPVWTEKEPPLYKQWITSNNRSYERLLPE